MRRMRRAEAVLLLALASGAPAADALAREAPPPPDAKEAAVRELLVGSGSERQRHNKVKRFAEIKAMREQERSRLLAEARGKAMATNRRGAKAALAAALASTSGRDADRLVRLAGHLREDWDALRDGDTPDVRRLRADRDAQAAWVHRRGFTRPGTDVPAAAFVFCDERFEPVPPAMRAFLSGLGFEPEEAEILVLAMELKEEVARRMAAARAP